MMHSLTVFLSHQLAVLNQLQQRPDEKNAFKIGKIEATLFVPTAKKLEMKWVIIVSLNQDERRRISFI